MKTQKSFIFHFITFFKKIIKKCYSLNSQKSFIFHFITFFLKIQIYIVGKFPLYFEKMLLKHPNKPTLLGEFIPNFIAKISLNNPDWPLWFFEKINNIKFTNIFHFITFYLDGNFVIKWKINKTHYKIPNYRIYRYFYFSRFLGYQKSG